ncbi:MAG: serine protease [Thiofilum sp.]|uniref:S1 family peptidase n=1 Tax=Thiofilum sp. TaxID=2212733 RepID=UPI0025D6156F|nr:serine protease [Thiofilum sp.]MBK8454426.1 trypsin-like peptidase domain-containing protein [Thiofilum sp.]
MQADLACLIGKIVTFTTHLYEDGECAKLIGTGFALREGLVITARHVLYSDQIQVDSTKPRKIYWLGGSAEGELVTEIIFEHAEWDIAVLACPTPAIKTSALLMSKPAKSSTPWESIGYLAAGMNNKGIRIETPASGTCVSYVPSTDSAVKHIQHLYPRDKLKTAEWQGMSGAPVFVEETAQLIGILIRTADALPDRLVMLSLAYVLAHCSELREKLVWIEHSDAFSAVKQYLNANTATLQALAKVIQQREPRVGDKVADVVRYLVQLELMELFKLIRQARQQSSSLTLKASLAQVIKRLLPSIYDAKTVLQLREENACGLLKIPYTSPVSAEVLMAGVTKREVDFTFYPISKINPQLVAVPGKYCLALPPETGSKGTQKTQQEAEDDLWQRIAGGDTTENIQTNIDEYLYLNIPEKSRSSRNRDQKRVMVNSTLQRLFNSEQSVQYYWILLEDDSQAWQEVVGFLNEKYPLIRLLCLTDDFEQEERERDLFFDLPDLLKDE